MTPSLSVRMASFSVDNFNDNPAGRRSHAKSGLNNRPSGASRNEWRPV